MIGSTLSLDSLWSEGALTNQAVYCEPSPLLPAAARRYLTHAITPWKRQAEAVRLRMHGEIKLRRWLPFTAEQVIRWDRGMIWSATVRWHGVRLSGTDRLLDGVGAMQWKLLGLIPVVQLAGPDISRSAQGRLEVESIWLPSVLCRPEVRWIESGNEHAVVQRGSTALTLAVAETGRIQSASLLRWGNPDGGAFQEHPFGGIFEAEKTFDGYTIPTQVRVGWHFGSPTFSSDGEFFHAVIDHATYR